MECGKVFEKPSTCSTREWTKQRKYCSRQCSLKHTSLLQQCADPIVEQKRKAKARRVGEVNVLWKGGQVKKTCTVCLHSFEVDKYRADTAKTCSKACDVKYRKTKKFRLGLSESQRKGISGEFYELTMTFAKFKNLLRRCSRYNMWRAEVLRRDDYTCQTCEKRGGRLCVDHIRPFIALLVEFEIKTYEEALECEQLWDVSNGQTLCYPCHYKTPTFGSRVQHVLLAKSLKS